MLFVFNKPTLFEKEKRKMSRKGKGSSNTEQFGEDEKRKILEIREIVTGLKDEIKALEKELLEIKQELKEIKTENEKIKQSLK